MIGIDKREGPTRCVNNLKNGKGIGMWDRLILWNWNQIFPRSKGNASICPIVHPYSRGQEGPSEVLGSSTKSRKPKMKFSEALTKRKKKKKKSTTLS